MPSVARSFPTSYHNAHATRIWLGRLPFYSFYKHTFNHLFKRCMSHLFAFVVFKKSNKHIQESASPDQTCLLHVQRQNVKTWVTANLAQDPYRIIIVSKEEKKTSWIGRTFYGCTVADESSRSVAHISSMETQTTVFPLWLTPLKSHMMFP